MCKRRGQQTQKWVCEGRPPAQQSLAYIYHGSLKLNPISIYGICIQVENMHQPPILTCPTMMAGSDQLVYEHLIFTQ